MKGLKHKAAVRKSINGGPMMLKNLSKWIFLLPPGQWQDSVTVTEEQGENLLNILIETYKKYQQGARTSFDYYRISETNFTLQNEPLISQTKQQDKSQHLEQQILSQEQNQQQNHYQEQYQSQNKSLKHEVDNLKFEMQGLKWKIKNREKESNKMRKDLDIQTKDAIEVARLLNLQNNSDNEIKKLTSEKKKIQEETEKSLLEIGKKVRVLEEKLETKTKESESYQIKLNNNDKKMNEELRKLKDKHEAGTPLDITLPKVPDIIGKIPSTTNIERRLRKLKEPIKVPTTTTESKSMPNDQPPLGRPMAYIPPRSVSPKAPRPVKSSAIDLEERLRKFRMPINSPTTTTTDSSSSLQILQINQLLLLLLNIYLV